MTANATGVLATMTIIAARRLPGTMTATTGDDTETTKTAATATVRPLYRSRLSEAQQRALKRRRRRRHCYEQDNDNPADAWPDDTASTTAKPVPVACCQRQQQPPTIVPARQKRALTTSLPALLQQRAQGQWQPRHSYHWQGRMTVRHQSFRSYTQQTLEFAALETPVTDAILGLDRAGCYALAIADDHGLSVDDDTAKQAGIVLKAYGLPSPAVLEQAAFCEETGRAMMRPVSPLLWAIPLPLQGIADGLPRNSLCAALPVELVISTDGRVGVITITSPSTDQTGCSPVAATFLVSLDTSQRGTNNMALPRAITRTHCRRFECNTLWRAEWMPLPDDSRSDTVHLISCPGYLVASKFDDKLWMTWTKEAAWHATTSSDGESSTFLTSETIALYDDTPWLSVCHDSPWDISDPDCRLQVVHERELDPTALLRHIISLHPKLGISDDCVKRSLQKILAFKRGGRVLEVCFGIVKQDGPFCLSVVVSVDLFTGSFQELQWTRHKRVASAPNGLSTMWDDFMLNWRMRQQGAGPYSVDPDNGHDWGFLVQDCLTELQGLSDFDCEVWRAVLETEKPSRSISARARTVSYLSLFPDSFKINNRAILIQRPIFIMKALAGPVKLVYMDSDSACLD